MQKEDRSLTEKGVTRLSAIRAICGTLIIVVAMVYTLAVVLGTLDEHQRIDLVTLGVIGFATVTSFLIMNPQRLDRLKSIEVSSFKLEMLEQVRGRQAEQESKLADLASILPLLLPKEERTHLLNLADGKVKEYKGGHNVRTELRALRSAGLVKSKDGTHISDLQDGRGKDISDILELTTLGKWWVQKIKETQGQSALGTSM